MGHLLLMYVYTCILNVIVKPQYGYNILLTAKVELHAMTGYCMSASGVYLASIPVNVLPWRLRAVNGLVY